VIKTAVKFERLQCVIRNVFSPFGCGDIDSRMKILIHIEKTRFECTKHLMHINNHDRQIKLASVVGLEPTIRLRRINSRASIGGLQERPPRTYSKPKIGFSGRISTIPFPVFDATEAQFA
jgi:hypothetical protein